MDELLDASFRLANAFVLPFWGLMILLPHWRWSVRILQGWWYLALLCLYYVLMIGYAMSQPSDLEMADIFSSPTIDGIHGLLSQRHVTPAAWSHYLAFDLFVGRWMFLREPKRGYWLAPLLLATFMLGPSGLLLYLLLRWPRESAAEGK